MLEAYHSAGAQLETLAPLSAAPLHAAALAFAMRRVAPGFLAPRSPRGSPVALSLSAPSSDNKSPDCDRRRSREPHQDVRRLCDASKLVLKRPIAGCGYSLSPSSRSLGHTFPGAGIRLSPAGAPRRKGQRLFSAARFSVARYDGSWVSLMNISHGLLLDLGSRLAAATISFEECCFPDQVQ